MQAFSQLRLIVFSKLRINQEKQRGFMLRRTDHDRNLGGGRSCNRMKGMHRQRSSIAHRRKCSGEAHSSAPCEFDLSLDQLRDWNRPESIEPVWSNLQQVEMMARQLAGPFDRHAAEFRTALDNCSVKQAFGFGHREQRADLHTAARFAEDGYASRVTAKSLDILADPMERGHDVEHSRIAGGRIALPEISEVEITEDAQPMVDRDNHHIAAPSECGAVVTSKLIARTVHEAAAVQPDHHWPFPPISEPGSPQVEHQAVFVLLSNAVWSKQSRGVEARRLHAGWSVLRGI